MVHQLTVYDGKNHNNYWKILNKNKVVVQNSPALLYEKKVIKYCELSWVFWELLERNKLNWKVHTQLN